MHNLVYEMDEEKFKPTFWLELHEFWGCDESCDIVASEVNDVQDGH